MFILFLSFQNFELALDSPCEGEQSNDKDLPYSMEIKLQETDSHTRQERDHDFSLSKSQHNREVRDELISPPKCQPVTLSEIKERADKIKITLFVTPEKNYVLKKREIRQIVKLRIDTRNHALLLQSVKELL